MSVKINRLSPPLDESVNISVEPVTSSTLITSPSISKHKDDDSEDSINASCPNILDFGFLSVTAKLHLEHEVKIDDATRISTNCDGITIRPVFLAAPGKHTIQIEINPEILISGALIEGTISLNSDTQEQILRVTGHVDTSGWDDKPSSSSINLPPWTLFQRFQAHQGKALCLDFASDGKSLFSGGEDLFVRQWDTNNGRPIGLPIKVQSSVLSLCVSRNGHFLALGLKDGTVLVKDAINSTLLWQKQFCDKATFTLAFSPNSDVLAIGSGDKSIRLCSAIAGELLFAPIVQNGIVTALSFADHGLSLASASQSKNICL